MFGDGRSAKGSFELAFATAPQRLMIRRDLRLVREVDLVRQSGRLTIGRGKQCTIRLEDGDVAPIHATLEHLDDGWHLRDAGSERGLRVNGHKTRHAVLAPGDVVDIRPFAMNLLGIATQDDERSSGDTSLQLSRSGVTATLVREAPDSGNVIRQRLDDLYALSRLILSRKDNGSFWQIMHAALQRCLTADRCVLVGVDNQGGLYRLAPRARPSAVESPLGVSLSVLSDTIRAGTGMLVEHVGSDARYAAAQSLVDHRSGSVICVPVMVDGRSRAVVYADRQVSRVPFQPSDLDFAMAAVDLAASAVSVDELQAQTRELSRVRGRIEAGREMQEMMLPSPLPQPVWGEVAALNIPADQMSGDIYDVMFDTKGRLVVSLADVSGKGVPAAFGTAIVQSSFRQAVSDHDDLRDAMRSINGTLDKSLPPGCFATMVVCRFSVDGSEVEIANAGHHAPVWLGDGGIETAPQGIAIALGIVPDWPDEVVRKPLSSERVVVLSSDGVTEATGADHDEYGLSRLGDCVARNGAVSAVAIADRIAEDVRAFSRRDEFDDDLTLVVVKRTAR